MIEVTLTWSELELAAIVGVRRNVESLSDGNSPHRLMGTPHQDLPGWQGHIEGAAGEAAVAKYLNRYWSGTVNTFGKGGDVGALQVRARSRHDYELIIRPKDRDDDWFVLVTGKAPIFRIRAWFVPHAALTPFPEDAMAAA